MKITMRCLGLLLSLGMILNGSAMAAGDSPDTSFKGTGEQSDLCEDPSTSTNVQNPLPDNQSQENQNNGSNGNTKSESAK